MNPTTGNMISVPKLSSVPSALVAGVHLGGGDVDNQPVEVHHGEGRDAGTVALQIGEACIWFSSAAALIALLGENAGTVGIAIAG